MRDWLELRVITISARPFMVLLRASLGLPSALDTTAYCHINQMQVLVQAILGLQNDILGWQKDHEEGNALNAVEILIQDGKRPKDAMVQILDAHNDIVQLLLILARPPYLDTTWMTYIRTILSSCNAMAEWMLSSRRYQTQKVIVPGLLRLMYHDSNTMHNGYFCL